MQTSSQVVQKIVQEEVSNAVSTLDTKIDSSVSRLDTKIGALDIKMDKVIEQLTDIAGQFKEFDEEQVLLSSKVSEHEDRIERFEDNFQKFTQTQ